MKMRKPVIAAAIMAFTGACQVPAHAAGAPVIAHDFIKVESEQNWCLTYNLPLAAYDQVTVQQCGDGNKQGWAILRGTGDQHALIALFPQSGKNLCLGAGEGGIALLLPCRPGPAANAARITAQWGRNWIISWRGYYLAVTVSAGKGSSRNVYDVYWKKLGSKGQQYTWVFPADKDFHPWTP